MPSPSEVSPAAAIGTALIVGLCFAVVVGCALGYRRRWLKSEARAQHWFDEFGKAKRSRRMYRSRIAVQVTDVSNSPANDGFAAHELLTFCCGPQEASE